MDEEKIVETYKNNDISLRELAKRFGTNHHMIKRILVDNGVAITRRNTLRVFTPEHRERISLATKGRKPWNKGREATTDERYQNIAKRIRYDVDVAWLSQFTDIEKLKMLNRMITPRPGRFTNSTDWYKSYIEKFYYDEQFNRIYGRYLKNTKDKYLVPSIDHVVPKTKGGNDDVSNLQVLSWFENRAKNNMTQSEWDKMKLYMKEYLI